MNESLYRNLTLGEKVSLELPVTAAEATDEAEMSYWDGYEKGQDDGWNSGYQCGVDAERPERKMLQGDIYPVWDGEGAPLDPDCVVYTIR